MPRGNDTVVLKPVDHDRVTDLFGRQMNVARRRIDRLFVGLMLVQWIAGIATAWWISPRTWTGTNSSIHVHVWAAILLGGVVTLLPVAMALMRPGMAMTRHTIAAGQMLWSALLIHLSGGRIETHFH